MLINLEKDSFYYKGVTYHGKVLAKLLDDGAAAHFPGEVEGTPEGESDTQPAPKKGEEK